MIVSRVSLMAAAVLSCLSLSSCGSEDSAFTMSEEQRLSPAQKKPTISRWRIAFTSNRDGNQEVYVMNSDGSQLTNLTNQASTDVVCGGGTQLLIASTRGPQSARDNYRLFTWNEQTKEFDRLTGFPVEDSQAAVSWDGNRYLVSSQSEGDSEIFIVNSSGEVETQITDNEFEDSDPSWSPGGFRVAYRSNRGGAWDIWIMNLDGSSSNRLTDDPTNDAALGYQEGPPQWSPDGERVLFSSERNGNSDLFVVNTDGWHLTNLTQTTWNEVHASWSPDGGQIAFDSDQHGNFEIFVMNADGSQAARLTDNQAEDRNPVWIR